MGVMGVGLLDGRVLMLVMDDVGLFSVVGRRSAMTRSAIVTA